jgi:hypothetical protein
LKLNTLRYVEFHFNAYHNYWEIVFLAHSKSKRENNSNKMLDGVVFSCQQIGVNTFYKCIEFQVNSWKDVELLSSLRRQCQRLRLGRLSFRLSFLSESISQKLSKVKFAIYLTSWVLFNSSFNYISVILWLSVLLADESAVPGENHQPATSHWQTLSHNVVSSTPRPSRIQTHNVSDVWM